MKLETKMKVNSKYRRKYHQPKTPYQRLMESDCVDAKTKACLKKRFNSLNPFELKNAIEIN